MNRSLNNKRYFILVMLFGMNCNSLQDLLTPIYVTAGLESSSIRFVSDDKQDGTDALARQFSPEVIRSPFTGLRRVLSQQAKDSGFYTLRSVPHVIAPNHWAGKYFAYAFTLDSPRVFRGSLFDYPDTGFVPQTIEEAIFARSVPQNDLSSRRTSYIYEETRAYATAYLGYFDPEGFSLAIGINFGQVLYNLTLIENRIKTSETLGRYRPMLSTTIMLSYSIGHYFSGTVFENTSIYLEATSENNLRYPLKTELLKSDGTNPPSLFMQSSFFRIGIIKQIDLIASTSEKAE
ncbi:MAG: hypothetical protein JJT78_01780 [Leptospira sp.]|nr:hypothetical protein [Leptospira sp.]